MNDETWRPLGIDTEEEVAEYDALHDGVPPWIQSAVWAWIRENLTVYRTFQDGTGRIAMLRVDLAEQLCQTLQIQLPDLRRSPLGHSSGEAQLTAALTALSRHSNLMQVVDYLLAQADQTKPEALNALLERGRSAWGVGVRSGKPGLVRRVPIGVQVAAESVMARSGQAGVRLAHAWEALYGVAPNPSESYRLSILAVEDAAVPAVSPTNHKATLGTVLRQIEDQADWSLPMEREHLDAKSGDVMIGMMRALWHGQHDRHGGQPSEPGNVSVEEATVAAGLAVVLVQWFVEGLARRPPSKSRDATARRRSRSASGTAGEADRRAHDGLHIHERVAEHRRADRERVYDGVRSGVLERVGATAGASGYRSTPGRS